MTIYTKNTFDLTQLISSVY